MIPRKKGGASKKGKITEHEDIREELQSMKQNVKNVTDEKQENAEIDTTLNKDTHITNLDEKITNKD